MNTTATPVLVHSAAYLDRYQRPIDVELHLSACSTLPKRFGKKIKAAGGRYSECRGDVSRRYVTLPIEGNEALIDTLCAEYFAPSHLSKTPGMTVVFRGGSEPRLPAWFNVVSLTKDFAASACESLSVLIRDKERQALQRGILHEVTQEQIDARQEEIKAEHRAMDIERIKATIDKLGQQASGLGLDFAAHLDAMNNLVAGIEG